MHCDTKVDKHRHVGASVIALTYYDVLGLYVEVQHVVIVKALQRLGNRTHNRHHHSLVHAMAVLLHQAPEVSSREVLHHKIGSAVSLKHLVNIHDTIVELAQFL